LSNWNQFFLLIKIKRQERFNSNPDWNFERIDLNLDFISTMRNQYFIILLALALASCKKEILVSSLPEATELGQNTVGFMADEKVWVPKWNDDYGWSEHCEELTVTLYNNYFEISGGIKINGNRSYFYMHVDSISRSTPFTTTGTISLDDPKALFIKNGGNYSSTCGPSSAVSISITKFDIVNKIVSGKFEARLGKVLITNLDMEDLYPHSPEFITISSGRFDVHYDYCR